MTGFHFWVECGEMNMCNGWHWNDGSALERELGVLYSFRVFILWPMIKL